jgi:peptide/nickel transport system permease protein
MSSGPGALVARGPRGAAIRSLRRVVAGVAAVLRDRTMAFAIGTLVLVILVGVVGSQLWPHDPLQLDLLSSLQGPSIDHPMGTDQLGRDVFARWCEGAEISMSVGAIVAIVGAILGAAVGLIAGTSSSLVDNALMRIMDAVLAFPALLLAMAVTLGLGVGLRTAAIGIIIPTIPWYARLVRSDVLRIRSLPFVEATVTLGATRRRTVIRHVLPHTLPTLAIQAGAVFSYSILTLAALGFVGLGAQIPTPEWGTMITDGLNSALAGQWWVTFFPGIGLLIVATAANVLADRVRDVLDPKTQLASESTRP